MRSGVLATRHMPEQHTGLNIATRIHDIVQEFKIPEEKVAGISRDNASNMDVAVATLGYSDTCCFGHTLQLAINSALDLPDIKSCVSAGRNVCSHFNFSVKSTTELRKVGCGKALQQDVATHWNSTYYMLNSLLPNRAGIYSVLHNKDFTKPDRAKELEIKNEHWIVMEKLCEVLKPFEIATSQLSGELYPTLGSVYPLIHGVLQNHMIPKEDDPKEIIEFKEKVVKLIQERFMIGEEHQCDDAIASALHPCYKKLKFLSRVSRLQIKSKLEELCIKYAKSIKPVETEIPELPVVPPKVKRESEQHSEAAMKYLLGDAYEISDDENDDVESEIDRYISEPQRTEDPLRWWKGNASRFPHLQRLARRYLCRPCTSVPSERIFSAAGNTVTKGRTRLDPDTVDELLFLHCYFKEKGSGVKQELINLAKAELGDSIPPALPTLKMEM